MNRLLLMLGGIDGQNQTSIEVITRKGKEVVRVEIDLLRKHSNDNKRIY